MTHHITDEQIDAVCLSLTGTYTRKERDRAVARAVLALAAPHGEPYGWAVTGCHSLYRGEWAESTAQAEARRCGGTAVAFPLYTAPAVPSDVLSEMREFGKARMAEFMGAHHMALVLSQKINEWADKLTAAPTPPAQQPVEFEGNFTVGHSKHRGGWFIYEECAPGEYTPIKGPFASKDEADAVMRDPRAPLIKQPAVPSEWHNLLAEARSVAYDEEGYIIAPDITASPSAPAVPESADTTQPSRQDGAQRMLDDIRAQGWAVAVHNDYRLNGVAHTFWLFTRGGQAVKGEGRTDADALAQVRAMIDAEAAATPAVPEDVARVNKQMLEALEDVLPDLPSWHVTMVEAAIDAARKAGGAA